MSRPLCPENKTVQVFYSRSQRPTLSSYDESTTIECMLDTSYHIFRAWQNTTSHYVGLKLVAEKVTEKEGAVDKKTETPQNSTDFVMDLEVFVVGCLFLDEEHEIWVDGGCRV